MIKALLSWYDCHRRHFPWRALPNSPVNPYHIWLSEIMLQQTTTMAVQPYFIEFISRWPTVDALAAATLEEVLHAWQGLGYYARGRNLHACAKHVVQIHRGQFPSDPKELLKLPGIGPYTAAAIAAIAYNVPILPIDTNVSRVMARCFGIEVLSPQLDKEIRAHVASLDLAHRAGDIAQAMMDLGATICLPKGPACLICPLQGHCQAYKSGKTATIPVLPPKKAKNTRHAIIFWLECPTGKVYVRQRPPKGLLGGMMEFPSSPWQETAWELPQALPYSPIPLKQGRLLPGVIKHTFTHFHWLGKIYYESIDEEVATDQFISPQQFPALAFPTLMKKVMRHFYQETQNSKWETRLF